MGLKFLWGILVPYAGVLASTPRNKGGQRALVRRHQPDPAIPMPFPLATYRLQFRNGMDFDRAHRLIPHLRRLGISHLYASPVFTAVTGSTHGYDVTKADEIDPALGGLASLRRLAAALHEAGMGLILDIVPNHMAASLENPWWRSVVAWGQESPYARHFDIDWTEKLTLPFLGMSFEEERAHGAIRLALDPAHAGLALRYHESFYPLHPKTYAAALATRNDRTAARVAIACAEEASPHGDAQAGGILSGLLAEPALRTEIEAILAEISDDPDALTSIHDAQPWVLTDWKTASHRLSYRRFFEIAGLAGLRVEDPAVFEDSHRLVVELVRDGVVDGLRIDHVDGLADPRGYMERLRGAVGPQTYIVVEKILERNEAFPPDWPVQGTSGYEFITALSDALVDEREGGRLASAFDALATGPGARPYKEEMLACKHLMLAENFAGEAARITGLAEAIAAATGAAFGRNDLKKAIRTLIAAFPVYRTYATAQGAGPDDRRLLDAVRAEADRQTADPAIRRALAFISGAIADNVSGASLDLLSAFRTRFQQLSGAVMAKAVEDTLFYRKNALIALNEVGGDPGTPGGGPAAFHAAMARRADTMMHGLSTTSTHDTKRGEDARARLYTLSEAPDVWIAATRRWRRMNAAAGVPEPQLEWLIYQSFAGAWPAGGLADAPAALRARMEGYVEKAMREAKIRSDWTRPDHDYENRVRDFVNALWSRQAFLADFDATLSPFVEAGLMNALSQTMIKLTAPGIPDIYQGSERSDFSLVDPDNRRPLDLADLVVPPEKPSFDRRNFAACKHWLVATVLAARRDAPGIFDGLYLPLEVTGEAAGSVIAFLRGTGGGYAVTIVPRLTFGKTVPGMLAMQRHALADTSIRLPEGFAARPLLNVLAGTMLPAAGEIPVADILSADPVCLLLSSP